MLLLLEISYLPLSYLLLRCPGFEPVFLITSFLIRLSAPGVSPCRVELARVVQWRSGGLAGGAERRDAVPLFLPL